jgi:hypothetical protein
MNVSYVLTATQLKKFNETAHEEGQNRILPIKDKYSSKPDEEELDMSKHPIITPMLCHINHEGKSSLRCLVAYGVTRDEEPRQSYLDVSKTLWNEMFRKRLRDVLRDVFRENTNKKR